MDPKNLPGQQQQAPSSIKQIATTPPAPQSWHPPAPHTQPQPQAQQPVSPGHPEAEPRAPQPAEVQPKAEQGKQLEKIAQPQKPIEVSGNLELSKEVIPGVEQFKEVHHVDEPIQLPSLLTNAGVSSVPLPLGAATTLDKPVVLPISQPQIQQGLHKSVNTSIRWLAEWCVKQLKEAHLVVYRKAKGIVMHD